MVKKTFKNCQITRSARDGHNLLRSNDDVNGFLMPTFERLLFLKCCTFALRFNFYCVGTCKLPDGAGVSFEG